MYPVNPLCPDCVRSTSGGCGKHTIRIENVSFVTGTLLSGWYCPCCRAVYAPTVTECWRCSPPMLNGVHECPAVTVQVSSEVLK